MNSETIDIPIVNDLATSAQEVVQIPDMKAPIVHISRRHFFEYFDKEEAAFLWRKLKSRGEVLQMQAIHKGMFSVKEEKTTIFFCQNDTVYMQAYPSTQTEAIANRRESLEKFTQKRMGKWWRYKA